MITSAMMPTTHSNPDQLDRLITQLDSGSFSQCDPRAVAARTGQPVNSPNYV